MVVINPGAGPVSRATLRLALKAMTVWRQENEVHRWERKPAWDGEGRYGFRVWHLRRSRRKGAPTSALIECQHDVLMPGLPVDRVRFVGSKGQNIWDFPRLYVDGNSWVWKFSGLTCDEDHEGSQVRGTDK